MSSIIDWPEELRPAAVDWPVPVVPQMGAAGLDGSFQTQIVGAPRWQFEVETGVMRLALAPRWEAFIQRLRGQVNRARAWDWRRENPLTNAPASLGSPVVSGAGSGASLPTGGWTPSITGVLLAGSRFSVNGELKSLSVDANSDASGNAVLQFEPPLRAVPTIGTALVLVKPTALFVLVTEVPSMPQQGARRPGTRLAFREVFA